MARPNSMPTRGPRKSSSTESCPCDTELSGDDPVILSGEDDALIELGEENLDLGPSIVEYGPLGKPNRLT